MVDAANGLLFNAIAARAKDVEAAPVKLRGPSRRWTLCDVKAVTNLLSVVQQPAVIAFAGTYTFVCGGQRVCFLFVVHTWERRSCPM